MGVAVEPLYHYLWDAQWMEHECHVIGPKTAVYRTIKTDVKGRFRRAQTVAQVVGNRLSEANCGRCTIRARRWRILLQSLLA